MSIYSTAALVVVQVKYWSRRMTPHTHFNYIYPYSLLITNPRKISNFRTQVVDNVMNIMSSPETKKTQTASNHSITIVRTMIFLIYTGIYVECGGEVKSGRLLFVKGLYFGLYSGSPGLRITSKGLRLPSLP